MKDNRGAKTPREESCNYNDVIPPLRPYLWPIRSEADVQERDKKCLELG